MRDSPVKLLFICKNNVDIINECTKRNEVKWLDLHSSMAAISDQHQFSLCNENWEAVDEDINNHVHFTSVQDNLPRILVHASM